MEATTDSIHIGQVIQVIFISIGRTHRSKRRSRSAQSRKTHHHPFTIDPYWTMRMPTPPPAYSSPSQVPSMPPSTSQKRRNLTQLPAPPPMQTPKKPPKSHLHQRQNRLRRLHLLTSPNTSVRDLSTYAPSPTMGTLRSFSPFLLRLLNWNSDTGTLKVSSTMQQRFKLLDSEPKKHRGDAKIVPSTARG